MQGIALETRDDWTAARLLPTAGIRNQGEQEKRATSALLAVMGAVPDFCHALLDEMKVKKGKISTYTELRFKDEEERLHIPDGAIVIERGQKTWSCLVEIKTNSALLEGDQVSRYLDLARKYGFNGLLTISNQIRGDASELPYSVKGQKLKGLTVYHLSWWHVLTEAIVQHRFRGISDPDQAWILGELIRYLDDEKSGAASFGGMGSAWVRVRESARNGTLRVDDPEVKEVSRKWEQFVTYLALHLSQELGVDVKHLRPSGKTPEEQLELTTQRLAGDGIFSASLKIPNVVGPIGIEANLRTRLVTTNVEVEAPKEGRPRTRINWLLKQLKDAPDDLRIDVHFSRVRATRSELLRDCRHSPELLLLKDDPKREPRAFVVALSKSMGRKDGRKEGSFVAETKRQVTNFYGDIVQGLVPPPTHAPKIRETETAEAEPVVQAEPEKSEVAVRREHDLSLQRLAEMMPLGNDY